MTDKLSESRSQRILAIALLNEFKGPCFGEQQIQRVMQILDESARSETEVKLDALAKILKDEDASLDVCTPGNHGGNREDADKWLVTIMPPDHRNIREFFGNTLAEALNCAAHRQGTDK